MKRLLIPAALLLAAATPAQAQWVDARTRPDLKHLWTPAPAMPFETTPAGFQKYLQKVSGLKILQANNCELTSSTPGFHTQYPDDWNSHSTRYTCQEVFYEKTDPLGTRRCVGDFYAISNGTANGRKPAREFLWLHNHHNCRRL